MEIDEILKDVQTGTLSPEAAKELLQARAEGASGADGQSCEYRQSCGDRQTYAGGHSYADMGFAKLDTDRKKRTGFPEVVFCQGKADDFLVKIYERLVREEGAAFGTRASEHQYEIVKEALGDVSYDPVSRILTAGRRPETEGEGMIAVCTGGTSDIPVAEEAARTAEYFGAAVERVYDVGVSGIHRLLSKMDAIGQANCVVAVAGMEGALASVLGGMVQTPVIAVPTSVGYGASFGGLSALLTMINTCANGISVVNIDNGFGAGYIATQINRLAAGGGRGRQDT